MAKVEALREAIIQIQSSNPNEGVVYLTREVEKVEKHVKDAKRVLTTTENYKDALSIIGDSDIDLESKATNLMHSLGVSKNRTSRYVSSFEAEPNKGKRLTVFVYEYVHFTDQKVYQPLEKSPDLGETTL
jgi:hypothetical protein